MTSVVLRFKGLPQMRSYALEQLQRQLPSIVLTPKTSTLLEAQLDESLLPKLRALDDWDVTLPSYAEIRRPSFDWTRIRDKLGS